MHERASLQFGRYFDFRNVPPPIREAPEVRCLYNPLRKLWERILLSSLCGKPRRARCRIPRPHGTTPRMPRLTPKARRACSAARLVGFEHTSSPAAYATGCTKIAHPALYPPYNIHSYPRYNIHSETLRQGCSEPRSGDLCTTHCASCGRGCVYLLSAASLGERDAAVCVSVGTRQTAHPYATARQPLILYKTKPRRAKADLTRRGLFWWDVRGAEALMSGDDY